jgi:hypothetical protein
MKKQTKKKLVLAKETVLALEPGQVVGGESEIGCAISNQLTCGCPTGDCTAGSPSAQVACKK